MRGAIIAKRIQVLAATFLYRISVKPAAKAGTVETALVGDKPRFVVAVLRAETKDERISKITSLLNHVAVWIVGVLRGDVPCLGDV